MVTREQSAQLVKFLCEAIPTSRISQTTVQAYVRVLQDLDYELARQAVCRLVQTSEFFPTLAAIRRTVGEVLNGPQRTGVEAWLDVMRKIRTVGYCGKPVFTDPIIQDIVDRWGWVTLCTEGDVTADRARFIEMYDAMARSRAQRAPELSGKKIAELT